MTGLVVAETKEMDVIVDVVMTIPAFFGPRYTPDKFKGE